MKWIVDVFAVITVVSVWLQSRAENRYNDLRHEYDLLADAAHRVIEDIDGALAQSADRGFKAGLAMGRLPEDLTLMQWMDAIAQINAGIEADGLIAHTDFDSELADLLRGEQ